MRGRLEPKDTVERFWGLKFIGFPNLSDETPKPELGGRFGVICNLEDLIFQRGRAASDSK